MLQLKESISARPCKNSKNRLSELGLSELLYMHEVLQER